MKTYAEIITMIQQAKTLEDLQASRREANLSELNGKLSMTEVARLTIARSAMRKALAARNHYTIQRLATAYAEIHAKDFESPEEFFEDLTWNRKHALFIEKNGHRITEFIEKHPKISLMALDTRIL